ncbi:MAG: Hpt domain-containing protein [Flavobacteriales bacterium]
MNHKENRSQRPVTFTHTVRRTGRESMEQPSIDLTNLERLFKGNRSRMNDWMRLYLQEAPGYFKQLTDSLATDDAETLAAAAHDLRPQAHYLGSASMLDLLIAIEDQARSQGAAACSERMDALMTMRDAVDNELHAALKVAEADDQNR